MGKNGMFSMKKKLQKLYCVFSFEIQKNYYFSSKIGKRKSNMDPLLTPWIDIKF